MAKKTGVIIGAALAAAAVVAVCVVILTGGKNEAYRSIMVYQVNGNATITRERVGEMAAYENLMLQSGDSVAVASESSMRLKLDDDKYLLAEQDTLMNIVADGNDENARTYIDLQKGSVTNEIQNKLKTGESYEVNTPNSIMAVRGTIFRVEVALNESGEPDTRVTVFEGTVSAKAVLADGTVSNKEVMVEAGRELTIEGTPTDAGALGEPTDIDYDNLTPTVEEYLEELEQGGLKLDQFEHKKKERAAETLKQEEAGQQEEAEQAEAARQEPQETEQPGAEQSEQESQQPKSELQQSKLPKIEQPETKQPEQEPQETEQQEAGQEETGQPESESQKSEPQEAAQDSGSKQEQESQQSSSSSESKKKTQYYTVTFQYNGSTFATQKVKAGAKAAEPKLCPTENGAWDYDFSKKVNKNLTIQWKQG